MDNQQPDARRNPHILVVEPVKATAVDLVEALRSLGCDDCIIAGSCDEALEKVAATSPGIVFMDIHLTSRDDGFDAAYRVAELHESAVIFLSTHSDEEDLCHALESSPFSYVGKPFEPQKIRQAMDAALAKHGAGQATSKELAELVVTDVLTGAGNRRMLQRSLRHEWHRCAREGSPLAVVMVNLDHFHEFNTRHGHAAGDECLQAVVGAMQAHCIRTRDIVARWTGVEFVALLPATHAQGARHVGQRIVDAVRDFAAGRKNYDASPSLTASVGVAVCIPEEDTPPESLLEKAQRALNAAREQGGDRVIGGASSSPAPAAPSPLASLWQMLTGTKPAKESRGRRISD